MTELTKRILDQEFVKSRKGVSLKIIGDFTDRDTQAMKENINAKTQFVLLSHKMQSVRVVGPSTR